MDLEKVFIKHQDSDNLPDPWQIAKGPEYGVSVPLLGRMYEVTTYEDEKGLWAVKTLKPEIADSSFYPGKSMQEVFDQHVDDHQRYLDHLGKFVSPAMFYEEIDTEGNRYYCRVDRYINAGIQFKEARKSNRVIPPEQLPDIEQRKEFVTGVVSLMNSFGNAYRIPDLDFFVESKKGEHNIVLFDTGYFYYEHNDGKDRRHFAHELSDFLFTDEEMARDDIKEVLKQLFGR